MNSHNQERVLKKLNQRSNDQFSNFICYSKSILIKKNNDTNHLKLPNCNR